MYVMKKTFLIAILFFGVASPSNSWLPARTVEIVPTGQSFSFKTNSPPTKSKSDVRFVSTERNYIGGMQIYLIWPETILIWIQSCSHKIVTVQPDLSGEKTWTIHFNTSGMRVECENQTMADFLFVNQDCRSNYDEIGYIYNHPVYDNATTQYYNGSEWVKKEELTINTENLQIKTNFTAGSKTESHWSIFGSGRSPQVNIRIKFNDPIQYLVTKKCMDSYTDFALIDNKTEKIWSFEKDTENVLYIWCNGQEVAKVDSAVGSSNCQKSLSQGSFELMYFEYSSDLTSTFYRNLVKPVCEDITVDNSVTGTWSDVVAGSVITITCNTNYERHGTELLTCQSDGYWGPEAAPTCDLIVCVDITVDNSVTGTWSDEVVGSVINITCNTNYERHGTELLTCQSDGNWGPEAAPTCALIVCVDITVDNSVTGTWSDEIVDTVINITCNTNYERHGTELLTCQSDRNWGPEAAPTCDLIGGDIDESSQDFLKIRLPIILLVSVGCIVGFAICYCKIKRRVPPKSPLPPKHAPPPTPKYKHLQEEDDGI